MNRKLEEKILEITLLKEEDLQQVTALEAHNFSNPYQLKDFREVIINPNKYYYVAKEEQKVVGVCGLVTVCGEGQIYNVSVDSTRRQLGIATKLVSYMLQQGAALGLREYTLEVRRSNEQAIRLYQKFGFQIEGERKNFYENPTEHAFIMWKR
ncbi:MAG: ribosomal protein S18-alanine N-acetyltransferase [Eubacteriales bacterium]